MAVTSKPTQDFVPIKEVRDGVVILKDGSMRALLMSSSVNFALKSSDEQSAIILQFQNFLNSLDFSVQIFIQSRRLDIRPYLALLDERKKVQTNELMQIQIKEYSNFVKTFTDSVEIMTKSFFLIIPYTPPTLNLSSKNGLLQKKDYNKNPQEKIEDFEENRIQLEQRVSVVENGLSRTGVRTVRLGTEEVIEVFYKLFNPGDVDKPINIDQDKL